ncbi:ferric reductase-like transmembrane domain-containing protein [Micromonospora antibiotica]|uniref:ferric reductase-like transmembrane domain-containing protein n=1 Tax=Micromonospora antibiotica TaxID=2807623 RepID=UPI0027DBE4C0|nr:ferric reductase-like transmembrane domain-containing protein [Micromonospora antibiotica]
MSKSVLAMMVASALGLLWAGVEMTGNGTVMYAYGFFFTEFFAGVVALVALSLTVMMGLLATDRLVLMIRHRVLLQSAHRATGVLGVAGLVFHVITKIAIGRAGPTDAVVPFIGGRGLYVGLGTVAAFLMVSVFWTGIVRVRFAGVGPKWFWRSLHSLAYLSWPFALFHGLNAGRAAKSWVVLSYLACVLLVVVALMVRLSVYLGKRTREQQQAAALNKAMTAKATDEGKGRTLLSGLGRKKEEETKDSRTSWAETTLTPSWNAPTGTARRRDPERFTVPVVPEPGTLREPVRGGRPARETSAPRRERDLEPAARRRTAERDERDERPRRRDEDVAPVSGGRRSRYEEDVAPVSGSRRARYEEDVAPVSGSRRSRYEEDVAPVSGTRRSRYEEDVAPVSGGRRSRYEEDVAPVSGTRRSRYEDEDIAPVSTGRRARRDDDDLAARYSAPPRRRTEEPEEPWDSPNRWESSRPVSAEPISAAPRSGSGRHSVEPDVPEEPDYWRPPARYVADDIPVDDTPTLVDLASRRARKATGDGRSRRKGKANADAVDGAYWAGLRGEAK